VGDTDTDDVDEHEAETKFEMLKLCEVVDDDVGREDFVSEDEYV
jgi:hypothetical protein